MPAVRDAVPTSVEQLTAFDYRNPAQLRDGGVLVVGAAGDGRADRRRAAGLGPPGDPLGG